MATTNSTKKELNKNTSESYYGLYAQVNTGNMAEVEPYISGGRYITGKKKNMTYTLSAETGKYEESGQLLDYDDYISQGNNIMIYGHPDKWVYDTEQKYNNCGVVSVLNILSIAGKIDIDDLTEEEIEAYKSSLEEDEIAQIPVTQEQKLTLYAIKHNYCNHSQDLSDYKTVNDIREEDGGSFLRDDVPMEEHQYHETITKINNLLEDYGVSATVVDYTIPLQGNTEVEEIEDKGEEEVEIIDPETGEAKKETREVDKVSEFHIFKNSGNKSINSTMITDGTDGDTLIFDNLTKNNLLSQDFLLIKDGNDLVISYYGPYTVRVKNYYAEVNQTTGEASERTCIKYIQFSGGAGTKQTLDSFVQQIVTSPYYRVWGNAALEANKRKFGHTLTMLSDYIKQGRGIILSGFGGGLAGTKEGSRHAVTLVGVKEQYIGDGITDVVGYYIVDSGGWISRTGGAQFISCETLYNYLTNCTYLSSGDEPFDFPCYMSVTDENIKIWADELNITGNSRRNHLYGNDSNNIIRGGGDKDFLYGQGGNDTIYGDSGEDWIYGGEGNNILNGGTGNDTYVFNSENGGQVDIINPGSGKDILRFEDQNVEDLEFLNKNGDLIIYYNNGDSTVNVKNYFKKGLYSSIAYLDDETTIDLRGQDNQDHYYNFMQLLNSHDIQYEINGKVPNNITGSALEDNILGGNRNDTIKAANGNDKITAGGGDDIIYGGNGNDTINSGYGNNRIYGEAGENVIKYEGDFGGYDTIYSGAGKDYIELTSKTKEQLSYSRVKNDLIVTYDQEKGSSFRITNYFAKQGKTSVRTILLKKDDGTEPYDIIKNYQEINGALVGNSTIAGGDGNDTLKGTPYGNVMNGGKGEDVIKGGAGNDVITGGIGCDIMYGQGGSDTFKFNSLYDGSDTIHSSGAGLITLDFSDADVEVEAFNGVQYKGFVDGFEKYDNGDGNFAFSKLGNNLVINYGQTLEQESMSKITIANYFSSKNTYHIKTAGHEYDLSNALVYIEGLKDVKNNITGSAKNDIIYGGDEADNIKAGVGNDIIYGGAGNDTITGGVGHNKIMYKDGDGLKTIVLTKNEQLDIVLDDNYFAELLSYDIDKSGNLLINHYDETIINLKGFGKTDVTGALGWVNLYIGNDHVKNLSTGLYLDEYNTFNETKKAYTGNWHSELINASNMQYATNGIDKGVNINGGAGNDSITGSKFNDTLIGGLGNDTITGGNSARNTAGVYGINSLDGGAGKDTYLLFKGGIKEENTVIKDSGKELNDEAIVYTDKNNLDIIFNVTKAGKPGAINITDTTAGSNNKAALTGVEEIYATADNGVTSYRYNFEQVKAQVVAWLENHPQYADVNAVIKNGTYTDETELRAIFNTADGVWT